MTIIFDNEEQKKKFINSLAYDGDICCPSNIGLHDDCRVPSPSCIRCWEQALEIEVKEKKDE